MRLETCTDSALDAKDPPSLFERPIVTVSFFEKALLLHVAGLLSSVLVDTVDVCDSDIVVHMARATLSP